MAQESLALDGQSRDAYLALAEVLFPRTDQMPSAREADGDASSLLRVLGLRPDLAEAVLPVLAAPAAGRTSGDILTELKAEDRQTFTALATAVAGAYYGVPEVRKRMGYPGQEPSMPAPAEADHDLRGDILAPVIARGPLYE